MVCSWAAYVAGALVVLMHERGLRIQMGMSLLIDSAVPEGKGVSSSAAVRSSALSSCSQSLLTWSRCLHCALPVSPVASMPRQSLGALALCRCCCLPCWLCRGALTATQGCYVGDGERPSSACLPPRDAFG